MKKITTVLILVVLVLSTKAQHEIGASIGTTHFLGDFGGGPGIGTIFLKDIDLKSTRHGVGVFYRYNFAKVLAVRAELLHGILYGNDAYSEEASRLARQLHSAASVFDLSVQMEVNFVPLQFCSGKARFSPYVAAGVGVAYAKPQIASNTSEGIPASEMQYIQNDKPIVFNIPISAGVKYKLKNNIVLGLEASYRLAFSDQLDAYVRQEKDQYFFVQAKVSYVFCKGGKGKMSKDMSCPTFKY